jgi:hypothetical protein
MISTKTVLEVTMVDTNYGLDSALSNFSQARIKTFNRNRRINETNEGCRHSDEIGCASVRGTCIASNISTQPASIV